MNRKTIIAVISVLVAAVCLGAYIPASVAAERDNGYYRADNNENYDDYPDPTGHCEDVEGYTDPTGHCIDLKYPEMVRVSTNYGDGSGEYYFGDYGDVLELHIDSPEDLEIVSFQFNLYVGETPLFLDIISYNSFTPEDMDMMYNERLSGNRVLTGSVSSPSSPYSVKAGDRLFSIVVSQTDEAYEDIADLRFEVLDMMVRTPKGDVTRVSNGKVTLIGDVSGNGTVDISDATILQKHLAEFKKADGSPIIDENDADQMFVCDVSGDGVITVEDVTMIQRYLAEYIEDFS